MNAANELQRIARSLMWGVLGTICLFPLRLKMGAHWVHMAWRYS